MKIGNFEIKSEYSFGKMEYDWEVSGEAFMAETEKVVAIFEIYHPDFTSFVFIMQGELGERVLLLFGWGTDSRDDSICHWVENKTGKTLDRRCPYIQNNECEASLLFFDQQEEKWKTIIELVKEDFGDRDALYTDLVLLVEGRNPQKEQGQDQEYVVKIMEFSSRDDRN